MINNMPGGTKNLLKHICSSYKQDLYIDCNSWRRSSVWNVLYCWIPCYIRNAQL